MRTTISSYIEGFLGNSLSSYEYVFVAIVWGIWATWMTMRSQALKAFGKQLLKSQEQFYWIVIPLALTVFAPFTAKPILRTVDTPGALKYIFPTLTFLLGNSFAEFRIEREKEKTYGQLLRALSLEIKKRAEALKHNEICLEDEQKSIDYYNTTPDLMYLIRPVELKMRPSTLGLIETILVQSRSFLLRDNLFLKIDASASALRQIETLLLKRQPFLESLAPSDVALQTRQHYHEDLKYTNVKILEKIPILIDNLCSLLNELNEATGAAYEIDHVFVLH